MALFASSSTPSPLRQHAQHRSPTFSAILENDEKEEEENDDGFCPPPPPEPAPKPTPAKSTPVVKRVSTKGKKVSGGGDRCVTCNICRPSSRDKISVVPVDPNAGEKLHHSASYSISPAGLRSLFLSLTRRTPCSSPSAAAAATAAAEWRSATAELTRKLLDATRKRDEALLEASRLKTSMAEMELKLGRLESYCEELKSAAAAAPSIFPDVETLLAAVSDGRAAVRVLARSIASSVIRRPDDTLRRVVSLLRPLGVPAASCRNPHALAVFMEALLARVFYGDFELAGFGAAAAPWEPLDPAARCEGNRAAAAAARGIRWEEVLGKGTRHYSEGLSRFCDRRMGEVVEMMGWGVPPTWPEGLLRAFFGAAKGVWVLHLMARSVHPAVPLLRVAPGASFDSAFMEDAGAGGGAPAMVRMMVAPGFYGGGACGVVKCKVLCVYRNSVAATHGGE